MLATESDGGGLAVLQRHRQRRGDDRRKTAATAARAEQKAQTKGKKCFASGHGFNSKRSGQRIRLGPASLG